ncbi:MAG: snoaL-like polyketide cyclase family protein [Frankiales bacterium]|jgi:steroid delta-isomerase-like uncharacterized protein|nr:snoaL-like polyketide cyclase family protein [Frankiales bacterium]
MNQANIDLIRRHLYLETQGAYDEILADMTDPPEYFLPALSDEPIRSREGVSAIHHMLFESLQDISIDIVTIDANDEFGFAEVVTSGVHVGEFMGIPGTGKKVNLSSCGVFLFRDGKIQRESIYAEKSEFLRQIGWTEDLIPPAEAT